MKLSSLLAVVALSCFIGQRACAEPLFYNPPNPALLGVGSEGLHYIADDFHLTQPSTVTVIVWWGCMRLFPVEESPWQEYQWLLAEPWGGFRLQFYDDPMYYQREPFHIELPGRNLLGTDSGLRTMQGETIYEWSYRLPQPLSLPAGDYFLSIDQSLPKNWRWASSFPNGTGTTVRRTEVFQGRDGWVYSQGGQYDTQAFMLIPEPSTLAMALCALPLAYFAYWRRQR